MDPELFESISNDLWVGKIPVEFSLSANELSVPNSPIAVHKLISRYSYLTAAAFDVVENFQHSAIDFSLDIWYEYSGIPLRSDLPVGVLHDIHVGNRQFKSPWKITIHFQNYPRNVLNKSTTLQECEKVFFHSMKQSIFLISGNTRMFNELSVVQQRSIWEAANTGNRSGFESVIRTVRPNRNEVKSIPVRLIRNTMPVITQRPVTVFVEVTSAATNVPLNELSLIDEHEKQTLEPTATSTAHSTSSASATGKTIPMPTTRRERTLRDVLLEDFQQSPEDLFKIDSSESSSKKSAMKESSHYKSSGEGGVNTGDKRYLVQGIEISLDFPIYDLWKVAAHCDLFLYIAVQNAAVVSTTTV